jgi:hypothetical protein
MNLAHDLAVLETMAEELPQYLLADVLFWQMQASSNFPKLSLGQMLLILARLRASDHALDADQRKRRDEAADQIMALLSRWQVAAETKAQQELRSRLNLWQRYWDDCREEPRTCADHYPHEVTQRTIAELLMRQFPKVGESDEARPVRAMDALVRARLEGEKFVWPSELQEGFPQEQFWFLYGVPRRGRAD